MTNKLVLEKRKSCEKIVAECAKGNFEKTLDYMNSNLVGQNASRFAIKILISCCNACVYRKDDISEDSLLKLLKGILPLFGDLSEADFISYLQSLYHINNFFINKGSLQIIIQMEDAFTLHLQPKNISAKHITLAHNIAKQLHNFVVNSALSQTDTCRTSLFHISVLMIKLCAKYLDTKTVINLAWGCFTSLNYIKIEVHYQIQYYQKLLHSFNFSRVDSKCEDIFKYIQNFSSTILYNIISTHDFNLGKEFLNNTASQIKTVLNYEEYIHFHQVLRYFLVSCLSDISFEIHRCTESLGILDNMWRDSNCKKDLTQNLAKLLKILEDYYCANPSDWYKLNEGIQLQMFRFIIEIGLMQASIKNNKDTGQNTNSSFYTKIICSLIKLYVTENSSSSLDYHQKCLDMLDPFLKQIACLKLSNYDQWSKAWNHIAVDLHNIAVNLYPSNHAALLYFNFLLKSYIYSDDIRGTPSLKYPIVLSTCTGLTDIHSKDEKRSLAYMSLAVFLCMKHRDSFMGRWLSAKHRLRDNEDAQRLNLVSALNVLNEDRITIKLDDSDKTYLLNLELGYYMRKWRSRISIVSALKELLKISDKEVVSNIVVQNFIETDLPSHEDIPVILADVLKGCQTITKTTDSKINLAVLYYIYYKSLHKKLIAKNAEDMERVEAVIPSKPVSVPTSDPSDELDIVSSFECLKLDVYSETLLNLELSLKTFTLALSKLSNNYEHVKLLQIYNVLLSIASEFRLLRFKLKCVQSLQLALKVAEFINDVPSIIKAIGLVVEQVGLNEASTQDLVNLADKMIENKNYESDHLELCIFYYMCKSKALVYQNYEESFKIFQKVEGLLEIAKEMKGLGFLKSQLKLLNLKFSMMPCSFGLDTHKKNLIVLAFSATEFLFTEYRTTKFDEPYQIALLIEASEELVKICHYLKYPREVKMYAKEILNLTQKMVLPLPSAIYLMYLAHADMLSNYQADCKTKIDGMANILTLNKENGQCSKFLNEKQVSSTSPTFHLPSFQMPEYVQHKSSCKCYYCDCLEYQVLVLEKTRLNALHNVKQNNINVAEDFFQGALKLCDYYMKKFSSPIDFKPEFLSSYGYILLNYSSHLWRTNCKEEAKNLNKTLSELVVSRKCLHIHLFNECLVQKLGYLSELVMPEPITELQVEMDNLRISNPGNDSLKTPENKQSHVSIAVQHSVHYSPTKLRVKKCLPFSFSPTESEQEQRVSKAIEKTLSPKVQIYSEDVEKRTWRRIKPNPEEINPSPAVQTLKGGLEKKSRTKTNRKSSIPVPLASSSSSGIDSNLTNRTKLLTEKLKKKATPSVKDVENQDQNNAQNVTKNFARKNLTDVTASGNDKKVVNKGAIRKSARTKK